MGLRVLTTGFIEVYNSFNGDQLLVTVSTRSYYAIKGLRDPESEEYFYMLEQNYQVPVSIRLYGFNRLEEGVSNSRVRGTLPVCPGVVLIGRVDVGLK